MGTYVLLRVPEEELSFSVGSGCYCSHYAITSWDAFANNPELTCKQLLQAGWRHLADSAGMVFLCAKCRPHHVLLWRALSQGAKAENALTQVREAIK